jgi:hypothetical protein
MYVPVDVCVGRWYYNVTGRCVVGWYVDGTGRCLFWWNGTMLVDV